MTYFIETKGSRAPNAACEGVDFTFNEIKYQSSVMMVQVKSSISKMVGQYDPEKKTHDDPGRNSVETLGDESHQQIRDGVQNRS